MRIAALLALLVACSDDVSLAVSVDHDASIASLVARTVVSIYAKPDLTCTQIEFGDVGAAELAGALVDEAATGEALANIPRVDGKLVVARGYDANGTLVAAGCSDKGVIEGAERVTVTTVPAATIAVGLGMSEAQRGLLIATTDANNSSLDGRAVSWRLYGAAGTSADPARYRNVSDGVWEPLQPTCTADGDANIHPMPPLLPGGYALQLRVSWAATTPRLFSAFTGIDATPIDLGASPASKIVASCALQTRSGGSRIVCMKTPTEVVTITYSVANRSAQETGSLALPAVAGDEWVGVIGIPNGLDRDVYAISNRGAWLAINGSAAPNPGATWCGQNMLRCSAADFATTQLLVVPPCDGEPAFLLSRSTDSILGGQIHIRKQPARGGPVTEYYTKDGGLVNAGCITELQLDGSKRLRQTVVIDVPRDLDTPAFAGAFFECAASRSPCSVALPTLGQAVGFSGGTEPAMIGSTFDATGASLTHWVVTPAEKSGMVGMKDRLVERRRQVAAAPPRQLVSGRFDADADEDLVWSFTSRNEVAIQIAYAREALGAPISALTTVPAPALVLPQPTQMFVADENGDQFDEVVFVFSTTVGANTNTTVAIVPTGVPYANPPNVPDDPACP